MHFRQSILSALRAVADGIPSNPTIREARVFPTNELPAVAYELDEDPLLGTTKDGHQEHELKLLLTIAATTTLVRDQIALELELAMVATPVAADQSFEGTELVTDTSSDTLVYGAQLTYTARVVVAEADPSTII